MCLKPFYGWRWVLFLLVYFLSAATLQAQDLSEQSITPSLQELPPTESATELNLSDAWEKLKQELIASEMDWLKLSDLLVKLQTETNELQYLWAQSTLQSKGLAEALEVQKKLALDAERSRDIWMTVGISAGALLLVDVALRMLAIIF
jgi:hypothetical protein